VMPGAFVGTRLLPRLSRARLGRGGDVYIGAEGYICICPARYQCTHCSGNPTTTQKLQWYEPRSPHTIAYEEHVARELVHSTVSDVCIKGDLGYEAVMGIIPCHIQTEDISIVLDRFHIAKLYRKGLNELRKEELKRLKKELSKEEYKKLKGAMRILRRDAEELTDEDLEVLKWLFKHYPLLELAYKLCNELTAIFEGDYSKREAKRKINRGNKRVIKSGLTCFNTFLSTLDKWIDGITNYFINRQTSGFVEGFNNKIKVIKRRCYGILNVKHLFQRIHLDLEGYSLFD
jgi:transposase